MRLLFLISLLIFSTKSPCAPFKGQAILAEKPILLDPQVRFFKTPGTVDFYFASYSHIKNEDESPQDLCLDFCAEEESAALDLFDKPQKHINHSTSKEINKLIAFLKKRIKNLPAQDTATAARVRFKLPDTTIYLRIFFTENTKPTLSTTPSAKKKRGSITASAALLTTQKTVSKKIIQISNLLNAILLCDTVIERHGTKLLHTTTGFLSLLGLLLPLRAGAAKKKSDTPTSRNMLDVGAKYSRITNVETKFTDVIGLQDAKEELQEIVNYIQNYRTNRHLPSVRPPRGILFEGNPGNGKTFLAKAVAGEAKCTFFSMSGSEFIELYVGVGAKRVRELFKAARDEAPAIVFIDEIDAIGMKRSESPSGGNTEQAQTLNQLLVEMDGFNTSENTPVFVIAATNRAELLDPALKRAGRFDKIINIPPPSKDDRLEILQQTLKRLTKEKATKTKALVDFAQETDGRSAAELNELMTDVVRKKIRRNKPTTVEQQDLEEALTELLFGKLKKTALSELEKERIATRIAGQALMCTRCYNDVTTSPLKMASIENRTKQVGFLMIKKQGSDEMEHQQDLFCELQITLAGIAALDINYGLNSRDSSILSLFDKAANLVQKILKQDKFNNRTSSEFMKYVFDDVSQQLSSATTKVEKIRDKLITSTNLSCTEIYNLTKD